MSDAPTVTFDPSFAKGPAEDQRVVRAGELVTVSLTLPGREKPITTATVRAPKKGDAAQRDLFEARAELSAVIAAPDNW